MQKKPQPGQVSVPGIMKSNHKPHVGSVVKAPPPANFSQPLQLKSETPALTKRVSPPPLYRPQPASVLQAKLAALRPPAAAVPRKGKAPLVPPIFCLLPPTAVQAKWGTGPIAVAALAMPIQLASGRKKGNPEKQRRQADDKKAKERSANRKNTQSIQNAAAYGGVSAEEAQEFVNHHGHIPGHHSSNSNAKMNDGTKKKVGELHSYLKEKRGAKNGNDDSDEEVVKRKGAAPATAASAAVPKSFDDLVDDLIAAATRVYEKADEERVDPQRAVAAYLDKRALYDSSVTSAMVAEAKAAFDI